MMKSKELKTKISHAHSLIHSLCSSLLGSLLKVWIAGTNREQQYYQHSVQSTGLRSSLVICKSLSQIDEYRSSTMPLYTLTITHSHTLTITCTCRYDEIKGTQDQDLFSCPFSDSLSDRAYRVTHNAPKCTTSEFAIHKVPNQVFPSLMPVHFSPRLLISPLCSSLRLCGCREW